MAGSPVQVKLPRVNYLSPKAQGKLDLLFETGWLLGITLVAFLFNGPNYFYFFSQPKQYALHFVALTLAVLWLFEFALSWRPTHVADPPKGKTGFWKKPYTWAGSDPSKWLLIFIGLFGIGQLLSALFSLSIFTSVLGRVPSETGYDLYTVMSFLVIAVTIVLKMKTRMHILRLLRVLVVIGSLTSLYGILQFAGWDPFGFGDVLAFSGTRVYSTYGNPIFFGSYVIMSLALTVSWILLEHQRAGKYWIIAAGVLALMLQVLGVWVTSSRGPVLTMVFVGIPIILVSSFFLCDRKNFYKTVLVFSSAGILAFFVALAALQLTAGEQNLQISGDRIVSSISQFFQTGDLNSFSSDRISIWNGAYELLISRENWPPEGGFFVKSARHIFGYGQNMYQTASPLTVEPRNTFLFFTHPHNFLLHIWLELGLFGFLSFVGVIGSTFFALIRLSRKALKQRRYASQNMWIGLVTVGLWGALAARAVEQFTGVGRIADLFLFWVVLALVAAVYRISSSGPASNETLVEKSSAPSRMQTGFPTKSKKLRSKRRATRNIPSPAYGTRYVLTGVAVLGAICALTLFILVDVSAMRGSIIIASAVTTTPCTDDGEVNSEHLLTLSQGVNSDKRTQDFAAEYVTCSLEGIEYTVSSWAGSSGSERLGYESAARSEFEITEQVLNTHLSRVPYSTRTLLLKRDLLERNLDWTQELLGATAEQQKREEFGREIERITNELTKLIDETWVYLRPFTPAIVSLPSLYHKVGDTDMAIEVARYIVDSHNDVVTSGQKFYAYRTLGVIALSTDDLDGAAENFQQALNVATVTSEAREVQYFFGLALARQERYDEARKAFRIATRGPFREPAQQALYTFVETDFLGDYRQEISNLNPNSEGQYTDEDEVLFVSAFNSLSLSEPGVNSPDKWNALNQSETYLNNLINLPEKSDLSGSARRFLRRIDNLKSLWTDLTTVPTGS